MQLCAHGLPQKPTVHFLRTLKCLIVKTIYEIKLYQMSGFKIYCFQHNFHFVKTFCFWYMLAYLLILKKPIRVLVWKLTNCYNQKIVWVVATKIAWVVVTQSPWVVETQIVWAVVNELFGLWQLKLFESWQPGLEISTWNR